MVRIKTSESMPWDDGAQRPAPLRRCIATGQSKPVGDMIRFVLAPDGGLTPDVAARLPGRGLWLTSQREWVLYALKKGLFSRGFRQQVNAPPDLAERIETMLAGRLINLISMARKAGCAVTGFEKVRARLRENPGVTVIQALDAGADGDKKLCRMRGEGSNLVRALRSDELGLAFGREFAIYAALDAGVFAARAVAEAGRLQGFRETVPGRTGQTDVKQDEAPDAGLEQGD